MPLDVEPPEVLDWDAGALSLFGLSSVSAAQRFSMEWGSVGPMVKVQEAQLKAQRKQADLEAAKQADLEAELAVKQADLEAELLGTGAALAALMTRRTDHGVFHRELQRIIALETPPSDAHEAAVHAQFRWMKLLCDEVFTDASRTRRTSLLGSMGMQAADCGTAFHSLHWRRLSRDGDIVDARLEEWQHGLKRVWATYEDGARRHEKVVALCMHVPVLSTGLPPDKKDRLPESKLLLVDGSPAKICDKDVVMHPFVLTVPRLDMLLRLQDAARILGAEGMQLTGVHGAGKSHMLETLSSILVHGGESDLVFHRSSADLLSGTSALLSGVAASSGPLSTILDAASSPPDLKALIAVDGGEGSPRAELRYLSGLWTQHQKTPDDGSASLFKALFGYMKSVAPEGRARVVIMDEVNELLVGVGEQVKRTRAWGVPCGTAARFTTSVPAFLQSWVEWKLGAGKGVLRILSSSPHGEREYVAGVSVHPRFELRPPRADHLGAVAAVAPEYLMGTTDPSAQSAGHVGIARMPLAEAVNTCDRLASNMRYVSRAVAAVSGGMPPSQATSITLHNMLVVLSSRLERLLTGDIQPKLLDVQKSAESPLWQTCLDDASLTVCESQDDHFGRLLAGKPSILAACAALVALAKQGVASDHLARALRRMTINDFEEQCTSRVHLNLLAETCARLPTAAEGEREGLVPVTFDQSGPILRVGEQRLAGGDRGEMWKSQLSFSRFNFLVSSLTSKTSVLDEPVVSVCSKLLGQGHCSRVAIQTVHNFPGTDIIELEHINNTMYVRLYEVTRSSIKGHSSGKHIVEVLPDNAGRPLEQVEGTASSEGGAAGKRQTKKEKRTVQLALDPVWGDVLALCGMPKHKASLQSDGSVKLARNSFTLRHRMVCEGDVGALRSGTSLINALLASMGVPLVVRRTVHTQQPSDGKGERITRLELSVEQSDVLCRELFGVRSGGDGVAWGAKGVTDWQLQVVYVSDTLQGGSENETALMESRSSISAPFVRYVFREQLQEVLPL